MADIVKGTFKTRWDWSISRVDGEGVAWRGQIKQKGNAAPSWLSSYEHGDSAETSTLTIEGPPHPAVTAKELCTAIWPVVDEYLHTEA